MSLEKENSIGGKQPGDPQPAAQVIRNVAAGNEQSSSKVLHLVLGPGSHHGGMTQLDHTKSDWDACEETAASVQLTDDMVDQSWGAGKV